MEDTEAKVNVTYAGVNGALPDPVFFDSSEGDIKQWVTEAIAHGGIPGIASDPGVDLSDYVVDRFPPNEEAERPFNLIMLRPKTPFGRDITTMDKWLFAVGLISVLAGISLAIMGPPSGWPI